MGLQAGLGLSGWYSPQEGLSGKHALEGMEHQGGEVLNRWWKWSKLTGFTLANPTQIKGGVFRMDDSESDLTADISWWIDSPYSRS